jgi:hypothetical protein
MRFFAAILLIALLAIGGGVIATTAYQAGLDTTINTAVANGAAVPVVVPYGVGWHGLGFGNWFFGLLAALFFLFLVFALLRVMFFRGMARGGAWGRGGPWAEHEHRGSASGSPWESRARDTFDDWHRLAHEPSGGPGAVGAQPDGRKTDPD